MATIELEISNTLEFSSTFGSNQRSAEIENTLLLLQDLHPSITEVLINNNIDFEQIIDKNIISTEISQEITFIQVLESSIKCYDLEQELTFIQNLSKAGSITSLRISNELEFEQDIDTDPIYIVDTLTFKQNIDYYIDEKNRSSYSPYISSTTAPIPDPKYPDAPVETIAIIPALIEYVYSSQDYFILRYFDEESLEVIMPNPDFGDQTFIDLPAIINETALGYTNIMFDESWPSFWNMTCTFNKITETKMLEFKDFINQTMGKIITIITHDKVTYLAIILNPDNAITATGKNMYSVAIHFMGSL